MKDSGAIRIAIIDPVGKKAGMDDYDRSLALNLKPLLGSIKVYSNFSDPEHEDVIEEHFKFTFKKDIVLSIRLLFRFISALSKAKKNSVQVVILHLFQSSFSDYLFVLLTRFWGFRICLIVHDVERFIFPGKKSWLRECIKKSSAVIVHNKVALDELKSDFLSADTEKLFVIPHGNFTGHPPLSSREAGINYFNLDAEKKYVLFFGMLKKSKGLDVLLNALNNVESNVHLLIAGRIRDDAYDKHKETIDDLGLTSRVHCMERYITNEERNYLFSLADIVVLPYLRIYQSGVMILAMSYGVPVIASDLPANREIIDGKNAWLFRSGDPGHLSEKINLLINDDAQRELLAKNAIAFMHKYHDWKHISIRFRDILTAIQ